MQAVDNETGFASLMDQHAPSVRATIRAVIGRSADEDDLVQEVFTRLLVRLRQEGGIEVGPWCRRAARNLAIDHLRRRSATPADERDMEQAYGDGLDREVLGRDLASKLAVSLRRLPAHERRVLLAQVQPGGGAGSRTHAEIGAEMGLSSKATESLLARARQRLRVEMRRLGADSGVLGAAGLATAALARLPRRIPPAPAHLATRAKLVLATAAVAISGAAAGMATAPLVTAGPAAHAPAGFPGPPPAARKPMAHRPAGGPGRPPVTHPSPAAAHLTAPAAPAVMPPPGSAGEAVEAVGPGRAVGAGGAVAHPGRPGPARAPLTRILATTAAIPRSGTLPLKLSPPVALLAGG